MKVIDLINDLFDYRELQPDKLPKKIRFNNEEFVFKSNSYYNEKDINIMSYVNHTLDLRVEVEIIEEDKEISKITKEEFERLDKRTLLELIIKNQNEIIDVVNELKKGK